MCWFFFFFQQRFGFVNWCTKFKCFIVAIKKYKPKTEMKEEEKKRTNKNKTKKLIKETKKQIENMSKKTNLLIVKKQLQSQCKKHSTQLKTQNVKTKLKIAFFCVCFQYAQLGWRQQSNNCAVIIIDQGIYKMTKPKSHTKQEFTKCPNNILKSKNIFFS